MAKAAYAQALKVIFGNPMVLISIGGRAIADAVRMTVGNNIILGYE